jgi:hypothetical protein
MKPPSLCMNDGDDDDKMTHLSYIWSGGRRDKLIDREINRSRRMYTRAKPVSRPSFHVLMNAMTLKTLL